MNKTQILLFLLVLSLIGNYVPQTKETSGGDVFMQKFAFWDTYVHNTWDSTNNAFLHRNLTTSESDYKLDRWIIAFHPLFLTYAYEFSGDKKYLAEAKYFVDALYGTTTSPDHTLIIYPTIDYFGLLDADVPMFWAMQRLNEFFGQSYDVTGWITQVESRARYNTGNDLAWGWEWNDSSTTVTLDEELFLMSLYSYLDSKGVANYESRITKMYHYLETLRYSNFYSYGEGETTPLAGLSAVNLVYVLVSRLWNPSIFSDSLIQASLNAYQTTIGDFDDDSFVILGAMTELALYEGFSVSYKLKTAHKQMIDLSTWKINNTVIGLMITDGQRQIAGAYRLMLLSLAMTGRASAPTYTYGSYIRFDNVGDKIYYQPNSTVNGNRTFIYSYYGLGFVWRQSLDVDFWQGIAWDFDTFSYNSTYGYCQGFKQGTGSLAAQNLTLRFYDEGRKAVALRNIYNDDVVYYDTLGSIDSSTSKGYLVWTNGTKYNVTSVATTRTVLGSNPAFWYVPTMGASQIIKLGTNASTTAYWTITVIGSYRVVSALSLCYEIDPFFFPTGEDTAIDDLIESILSDYVDGENIRDRQFSMSSESSIKWKFKAYSDIAVWTDKNMTSSSYDGNKLAFTINAGTGQTSTNKIYVGSHANDPKYVSGATSWSRSGDIITVTRVHSSPASILIFWKLPGDIDSDNYVDVNDLHLLAAAYGNHVGEPSYNTNSDINWDGNIDANDLYMFAENYGKNSP